MEPFPGVEPDGPSLRRTSARRREGRDLCVRPDRAGLETCVPPPGSGRPALPTEQSAIGGRDGDRYA
jgi:hypothetical protein